MTVVSLLGSIAIACAVGAVTVTEDVQALTAGVNRVARPGVPGPLAIFGPRAFAVATGRGSGGANEAVVAAARIGEGRVVAFGHGGFLGGTADELDSVRFVENAVRWAGGASSESGVVVVVNADALADRLEEGGLTVERSTPREWSKRITASGDGHEAHNVAAHRSRTPCVLVIDAHHFREEAQRSALEKFITEGGGLVTASLGWGWMQLNPDRELVSEHPGNRLLAPYGIAWADGTLEALARLERQAAGEASLSQDEAAQACRVLLAAAQSLPAADVLLRPALERVQRERGGSVMPTAETPLGLDHGLDRVVIALEVDAWQRNPTRALAAHPAAALFPGVVDAPALESWQRVAIDPSRPGWQSTGFYAAPGATVELRCSSAQLKSGLRLRIGAHSDRNWHHQKWERIPEITIEVPIAQELTRLASPFGGLVYVVIPDRDGRMKAWTTRTRSEAGTEVAEPSFPVELNGVVRAPRFVLGVTDLDEWRESIRHEPAPWAELESSKLIVTVPSEVVRTLDDPAQLMEAWDRVMDACADLAAMPHQRVRPERLVADQQISAGYMHAGYPIMMGLDVKSALVDRDALLAGSVTWGFFHEIGHNHQSSEWTFGGTGEVTVNLFSLYVLESVCGLPPLTGHGALRPKGIERDLASYFDAGAPFETWKREPFLALAMYAQLRVAFGWDVFKSVFVEYRELPESERPKGDDEKRDQWMVRFSRHVSRNLGPFFQAWGVPTSEEARASIADLPVWMPEDIRRIHTKERIDESTH